ncbi:hypothetical protein LLEC1_03524 [Akanthomyces lecanii]|uniref:Uncharacterized protein n=1 Tax=Cordyceps confragosa TaxID=2714763 RepID=A0A179IDW3_CORDF|nr:hypothetical protein LLEC1_03524 [Akanthomyces lecanii]
MEYEPVPKRRRTASPPPLQSFNGNTLHASSQHGKGPEGADDKTYQLHLERAFADPRFRATLAQIFDKYDGKSAKQDEAIDPALCEIPTADNNFINAAIDTHLDSLVHTDRTPYHLDMRQHEPKDDGAQTLEYQLDQTNENADPYAAVMGTSGYMPGFPGAVHPGFMQTWYGNPFQGPGAGPSPWDGFSGQLPVPHAPHMTSGPWIAPENFAHNPATWPSQALPLDQSRPPISQLVPAPQPLPLMQHKTLDRPGTEEDNQKIEQEDESTDNCQLEPEISYDALGRKRRRRPMQPRFSKNGKRLGRPPKAAAAPGVSAETGASADAGAYDGEGEDNGGLADLKNPAGEFGDEDDDTLWSELAEALQLASKATSKKKTKDAAKVSQKGENSATESDRAAETEKCAGQAETMLKKIQQELIDRAVRRSTMAKEPGDDTDGGAEGRRRSGRERKPANFGEQVSWDKVSAERRTSYKIKMHLRALSVQARRERKRQEKEEAEVAAREKEAAEKVAKERREAEELAAGKDTPDGLNEPMPSTIPDSQETVTSLPIRTTPKKPQSTKIMRQTIKNHVNSVVHFEEDDEGLSDDQAPAAFPIKTPVFSYKKPEMQVHSFLGENYIDTVYALSDDEAPALLDSLKRVSLGEKKRISLVPVAVARPRDTVTASKLYCTTTAKQAVAAETAEEMREESTPSTQTDTNARPASAMDSAEIMQLDPVKPTKPDEATRPSVPTGGDGDDSGIDIRSEQASSEQASSEQVSSEQVGKLSGKWAAGPAGTLPQDPNILGAADILDSLDVVSEAEYVPCSPMSDYDFTKEDMRMDDITAASAESALVAPRMTEKPIFVDEEPTYESMDISEAIMADLAFTSDKADVENDRAVQSMVTVSDHSARLGTPVEKEYAEQVPSITKHGLSNIVFIAENPEEIDIDADEDAQPFLSKSMTALPPPRHPLPRQSKPKGSENQKPTSSMTTRAYTPKAASKEPSPSSTGERPRLSSSRSSSRTPAPVSKADNVRKGSSSRRSLLSLIGGGEDDIESLIKKKSTTTLPTKPNTATAPAPPSSSTSRRRSSSAAHGSSRRKVNTASSSSSSLTRLSLGSLSSLSRDKPRSSKERQEAKERRRKSAGAAAPSTNTTTELKGTCGVDGYTCGRDFCFTCL